MNFFEKFLRDLLIAGEFVGPIFIKSQHGVAILNASEEGLAAILAAHQTGNTVTAATPAVTVTIPAQ